MDQQGFLHIPRAVPVELVDELLAISNQWLQHKDLPSDLPAGLLHSTDREYPCNPEDPFDAEEEKTEEKVKQRQHMHEIFTSPEHPKFVSNVHYGHTAFQRLLLSPEVMRVVSAMQEQRPVLVDTQVMAHAAENYELYLHGARGLHMGDTPDFAVLPDRLELGERNGSSLGGRSLFFGYLNVAISLVDVPERQGFVV